MDVGATVVDYLLSIKHLGSGTRAVYQQHLTVFSDWCAGQGLGLEAITNRNVQAFLEWLVANHRPHKTGQTTLSTHTRADYVRSLKAFLHWCLADEEYSRYVKLSVVQRIKLPRTEQTIKTVFTDEEINALFDACKHPDKTHEYQLRDTAILALLVDCGLRASELRTLTIGNVTLARETKEDSYIRVMGKGRKEREILLGNRARRALARYLRECRSGAAKPSPVFLSRYGGQMAHETLKDLLSRLKAVSRLPAETQVNPHKFRHSFATRYMANGGDIYDLSRLLGHTSVSVTEGYLRSLSSRAIRMRSRQSRSVLDEL